MARSLNSIPDGPPRPGRWGSKLEEIREGQKKYYERNAKIKKLYDAGICKKCKLFKIVDCGYGGFSQICPALEPEDCPYNFEKKLIGNKKIGETK